MIQSITLLGSSSGRNAGDAALLSGIMDSIDGAMGTRLLYEIPITRPEFIWHNYQNRVRPVSMMPWSGAVRMLGVPTMMSLLRTDLALVFDAILFDRSLYNPLFNFLSTLYLLLPLAKKRGKRLGCFNVGAGPVESEAGRKMLREVCELMDFISVRDEDSLTLLRDIGVKNPRILVTADAALNLCAADDKRVDEIMTGLGLNPEGESLGVNVSAYIDSWITPGQSTLTKEKFIRTLGASLDKVARQIGVPLVFVCTQHHDVPLTRELMQEVTAPVKKVLFSNVQYSHYDVKGVLGRISLLFAMRLHAAILATSAFTPCIALPHQPKVTHYFKTLGLEEYIIDFASFEEPGLSEQIISAWEKRPLTKSHLLRRIPQLKIRALSASDLVRGLGQGEDIDRLVAELHRRDTELVPA